MFTIKNLKLLSSKRASKAEAYPVSWVRQIVASGTEELFEEFNTRPGGLEPDEVELARASYGANELSHKKCDPEWLRFLKAFADPFTGVLALLALVTLAGDVLFAAPGDRNPLSLLIICGMILVSGILRFVQEGKSSVAADALASSIETFCLVERAGGGRHRAAALRDCRRRYRASSGRIHRSGRCLPDICPQSLCRHVFAHGRESPCGACGWTCCGR